MPEAFQATKAAFKMALLPIEEVYSIQLILLSTTILMAPCVLAMSQKG